MKRWLVVLLVLAPLLDAAAAGNDATEPPDRGRGEWLLERIRQIADRGWLTDPAKVGEILGFELKGIEKEEIPQPPDCSNPHSDASRVTTTFEGPGWYANTPEGLAHMIRPGFAINREAALPDPSIAYRITRVKSCRGRRSPMEYVEAQLTLGAVSGFACLNNVSKIFPTIERLEATDGALEQRYIGRHDDYTGVTVEFSDFVGARCILAIQIEQSDKRSMRFERAMASFNRCDARARKTFCETKGAPTWGEGKKLDMMENYSAEICGEVGEIYSREPFSNEKAIPYERRRYGSPCD
ncbi:hypothetical protein [Bradyrhizobium sp. SSUT77]|uniref:hypothetical protein n=1 Tax=Bradyrhizobium sp. SSUT77 TaxID=3040603 RepID=UPI00244AB217|nr:hypothetical protein [Bradyrhizobium sp. SSUT77]MDH2343025.1 hypothetical protein [Bradyrhizobium sp. SSUT77]